MLQSAAAIRSTDGPATVRYRHLPVNRLSERQLQPPDSRFIDPLILTVSVPHRDPAKRGRFDPAERELLLRLVAGEFSAWREFVERYQGIIYSGVKRTAQACRRNLGPSDIEDVVAEVFAALVANDYAALRRFKGRARLSTWLTVLARRYCLRHLRRNQRSDNRHFRRDPAVTDSSASPLALLINSEESTQLRRALRKLSDADRTVLNLYYDQQLGYAEIGRRLGIAENSVGSRIHRVHKRLEQILNQSRQSTLSSHSGGQPH